MARPRYDDDQTTAAGQKRLMAEAIGAAYIAPQPIDRRRPGEHGADSLGNGTFRMVPSGDIVDLAERTRRLAGRRPA